MCKIINYYEFTRVSPRIEDLQTLFKRHLSKFNVPFFEAESEPEIRFLEFCHGRGFQIQRRTIIEYGRNCKENVQFLYLTLKDDQGCCISQANPEFIDLSKACPGDENFGMCNQGATQIGKVKLSNTCEMKLDDLGLLVTRYPYNPRIYLLSHRLARILREAKPTGCEIVPCVAESPAYQLQVTCKSPQPVKVGQTRISKQCSVCGTVKLMFSRDERYFRPGDLADVDFQACNWYETENVGTFYTPFPFIIVSRRIFDLLLDQNVKGLFRYTTDPPIRHAVVQIK